MPAPVPPVATDPRSRPRRVRPAACAVLGMALMAAVGTSCATTTRTAPTASTGATATPPSTAAGGSPVTTPAATGAAQAASRAFSEQLDADTAAFVAAVARLQTDAAAGDMAAARADDLAAQSAYDGFRALEAANAVNGASLDELATDVTAPASFGGLHAVERDLWATGPLSDDVSGLAGQAPVAQFLLSRQRLGAGAVGLVAVDDLDWVVDTALPVSQEQYAHLGVVDVAATEQAARQAFDDVEPLARLVDPDLTAAVAGKFTELDAMVAALGDPTTTPDAAVTSAARLALSQQLDATASALARLVARLAPFGTHGAPS